MADVPEKIRQMLDTLLEPPEQTLFLLQTEWKPNDNTPRLWLAGTDCRLILFSTRKHTPLFKSVKINELNSVVSEERSRVIRVLYSNYDNPDLKFRLADSVSEARVAECLNEINSRIAHTRPAQSD